MVQNSDKESVKKVKKAKSGKPARRKPNNIGFNLVGYFRDVYAEMKKVTWPSWEQLVTYTGAVLLVIVAFIAVFGIIDLGLEKIFEFIINIRS